MSSSLYTECIDIMNSRVDHLRERDWITVQDTIKRAAIDGNDICKVKLESGTDDLDWLERLLGNKYRVFKSKVEVEPCGVCTIMWKVFKLNN